MTTPCVAKANVATVSITLDTYSHAIPAMQEEAAALVAGQVFAKAWTPIELAEEGAVLVGLDDSDQGGQVSRGRFGLVTVPFQILTHPEERPSPAGTREAKAGDAVTGPGAEPRQGGRCS